jgi:hypothetical protein
VVPLVFKTSEGLKKSRVGSIPIRLRHYCEAFTQLDVFGKVGLMDSRYQSKWVSNKRLIFSLLLVPAAVAALVYGIIFHSTAILAQRIDEVEDDSPDAAAQRVAEPLSLDLREPAIIFDVTVGGLVRLDSGTIKRTYSGKPPSACPT